jgi:hypothetical protein
VGEVGADRTGFARSSGGAVRWHRLATVAFQAGHISWTLQEPQTERGEYQDDPDVYYQPIPELVPEEQDVNTDNDGNQRKHEKYDGCLPSHRSCLLCVTVWSKSGADGCSLSESGWGKLTLVYMPRPVTDGGGRLHLAAVGD